MEIVIDGIKLNDSTKLKFVSNPKRVNSAAHKRYESYQKATNLKEYFDIAIDGKFNKADLRFDVSKKHLKLFDSKGNEITSVKTKK